MSKILYAAAVTATKLLDFGRVQVSSGPVAILADNREEALGIGYTKAHELYPSSEGYQNQQVSVMEIPYDLVRKAQL